MKAIIEGAIARNRATLLVLLFIIVAGTFAYRDIPKESEPDIAIPLVFVSVSHEGISPNDAERLLAKPLESELRSIEGLDKVTTTATEGFASLLLEFDAGFDAKQALIDVREKVDFAKSELPDDSDEPVVQEINVALFPVLSLSVSGAAGERQLLQVARDLEEKIEGIAGVLDVEIGGDREEVVEILVDPTVMDTYGIDLPTVLAFVRRNNQLVAAGSIDTSGGRFSLKVPGVLDGLRDVLSLPVHVAGNTVVTIGDVATVHRTFKDPTGFARVNGRPALVLEVKKRIGANIIETIERVEKLVDAERPTWPAGVQVDTIQDKSDDIRDMLADLQNNVSSAIVLVMIVILGALGWRSAGLVGLSIPASFLAGILVLSWIGVTMNIVVLFSLILVVGMLVDGAIVVAELAVRNMDAGMPPPEAYSAAAQRMSWPITASTATTLAVFLPLLFWPGLVGEFMSYLPLTVLICLSASLVAALVFIPVLGATFNRQSMKRKSHLGAEGDSSFAKGYARFLRALLRHPGKVAFTSLVAMLTAYGVYGMRGLGVEFFPEVEPESVQIHMHARGDLSIVEKDRLLQMVEARILDMPALETVYARSISQSGQDIAEDVAGVIQIHLAEWDERPSAASVLAEIRQRIADVPGVILELRKEDHGPSSGKPIQIDVTGGTAESRNAAVDAIRDLMLTLGGFEGEEDNRAVPGIEWRLAVDRELAARFGADIALVGNAVQLITNGIKATDYRPDDSVDEIDVRVRFPRELRHLDTLGELRVKTVRGLVPIDNFVKLEPAQRTGTIIRVNGKRTLTVKAGIAEGRLADERLTALRTALDATPMPAGIVLGFAGEDEDMRETSEFLTNAFLTAVFLMAVILMLQFNRVYQTLLVLSAIVLSTAGVLVGLLITNQPFGLVMVGLGIIALAGIVVNNNIVLIDTYNEQRGKGLDAVEAAVETGRLRLRPVLLTAATTVLGLMPMVLSINIDFVNRHVSFGAPSTQWWTQLSTAIAGGLVFATILTLAVTPCLLVLGDRLLSSDAG